MNKIILHVGSHKTGTTAIQKALEESKTELGSHNFAVLTDQSRIKKAIGDMSDSEASASRIRELFRLAAKGAETLIVSYEGFSGSMREGYKDVGGIVKVLSQATDGCDVQIVVYFRRQDDFIETVYAQMVHEGESLSFGEYLETLDESCFSWLSVASSYAEAFGRENITVEFYDSDLLQGAGLLENFFEVVGLGAEGAERQAGKRGVNVSLKGASLEFLRICNRNVKGADRHRLRMLLQSTEQRDNIGKGLLNDDQRMTIFNRYLESNIEVEATYMGGAKGRAFMAAPPSCGSVKQQDLSVEELTGIAARLILDLDRRSAMLEQPSPVVAKLRRIVGRFLRR